ncbi:hypothetical protein EFN22_05275 [Propionibacterium freudenreichii]|nr:hypothetical protein [Propionibacterium freudenreichii]
MDLLGNDSAIRRDVAMASEGEWARWRGDMRSSARGVENSAANIEQSSARAAAASDRTAENSARTARASEDTARSARSAATASWVSAGFAAVSAIQNARAARAAEEQTAITQSMAAQEQTHQFAMWRQTEEGKQYVAWRNQAIPLAQLLRDRQTQWQLAWAQAIGNAQDSVSAQELEHMKPHTVQVRSGRLKIAAVILFILGGFGLITTLAGASMTRVTVLGVAGPLLLALLMLAVAVYLTVNGKRRRQEEQTGITWMNTELRSIVAAEAAQRVARFGFDPLAVPQGYTGFTWGATFDPSAYADQLMWMIINGPVNFPEPDELPALVMPDVLAPNPAFRPEVNAALADFQQQS